MVCQDKVLGHIVSRNGIPMDLHKIKRIVQLPRQVNYKGVQNFMGRYHYYNHFIYMCAEIARPMYDLIVVFEWTLMCENSFEKHKKALITAPILQAVDWDKVFHFHINASRYAIGCILAQPRDNHMEFPYLICQ